MLQQIKDFYADMATKEFEMSDSEAAKQWFEDGEKLRYTEAQDRQRFEALESLTP